MNFNNCSLEGKQSPFQRPMLAVFKMRSLLKLLLFSSYVPYTNLNKTITTIQRFPLEKIKSSMDVFVSSETAL